MYTKHRENMILYNNKFYLCYIFRLKSQKERKISIKQHQY